jgi:hypothetical protein
MYFLPCSGALCQNFYPSNLKGRTEIRAPTVLNDLHLLSSEPRRDFFWSMLNFFMAVNIKRPRECPGPEIDRLLLVVLDDVVVQTTPIRVLRSFTASFSDLGISICGGCDVFRAGTSPHLQNHMQSTYLSLPTMSSQL